MSEPSMNNKDYQQALDRLLELIEAVICKKSDWESVCAEVFHQAGKIRGYMKIKKY